MEANEEHIRQKWNIPDWRDADSYPTPQGLNDTLWRWEFLRRRSDYRQDWERYGQETYQCHVADSKDPQCPTRFGKKVLPPDHPKFLAKMSNALEKYHLHGLPNPAIREPWMLSFDSNYGRIYFGQGPDWVSGGEQVTLQLPEWKVATVFDLKKPLRPQLKKIEKDLLEWQTYQMGKKLERRKVRDQWPLYLRILDAVDVGTPYKDVGEWVFHIDDEEAVEARVHHLYTAASQLGQHFPS